MFRSAREVYPDSKQTLDRFLRIQESDLMSHLPSLLYRMYHDFGVWKNTTKMAAQRYYAHLELTPTSTQPQLSTESQICETGRGASSTASALAALQLSYVHTLAKTRGPRFNQCDIRLQLARQQGHTFSTFS